ncbi:MAG: hypothetical protein DRN95_08280 [Candidatus Hydrothermarchaeota archaeon]|nr:MAG: hypothetical protein DRN95_08280 [Candidatus Hydrothermarchaeota archaeon]
MAKLYNHLELEGLLEVTGLILSVIGAYMTVSRLTLSDTKIDIITIPIRRSLTPEYSKAKISGDARKATNHLIKACLTPAMLEEFDKELSNFIEKLIRGLEKERNKAKIGLLVIIGGIILQIIAKII